MKAGMYVVHSALTLEEYMKFLQNASSLKVLIQGGDHKTRWSNHTHTVVTDIGGKIMLTSHTTMGFDEEAMINITSEFKTPFTKKSLLDGMKIHFEDGSVYAVLWGSLISENYGEEELSLLHLTEDLTYHTCLESKVSAVVDRDGTVLLQNSRKVEFNLRSEDEENAIRALLGMEKVKWY